MAVISKRFEKYGLTVHPDKTKLIDFRALYHPERRREEQSNGDNIVLEIKNERIR